MDKVFTVLKSKLKAEIVKRIMKYDVELRSKLTNKLILDTIIYLEGYTEASKDTFAYPLNREEVEEFLYDEAFKYVLRNTDDK